MGVAWRWLARNGIPYEARRMNPFPPLRVRVEGFLLAYNPPAFKPPAGAVKHRLFWDQEGV